VGTEVCTGGADTNNVYKYGYISYIFAGYTTYSVRTREMTMQTPLHSPELLPLLFPFIFESDSHLELVFFEDDNTL
jgi:hypothetical protein